MNKSDTPAVLLSTLRTVGAAAFLAPAVGAKKLHINEDADGEYLVRLFAARNIALIVGVLASKGETRRLLLKAGILCDGLDVAAGILGHRKGRLKKSTVVDTSAAATATLLGLLALSATERAGDL
ncbi:hypothetical protein [Actinacidiphila alni]|uniref:DUF4267 domain-containing protein n=1 Tax=Actinacidiphila alni TaxID=380248 RepID=A0A1I2I2Y9_9ACTN|nr:hypothetical protein [Actinacidiphila alni]SFF35447.1 hypothetical protein SAMN05216251_11280 [Actinacidiphila alni]